MYRPPDPGLWQGRIDREDGAAGARWHQVATMSEPDSPSIALLGLACDLGVVQNKGRPGASAGPMALRQALANQAWHHRLALHDCGDVVAEDELAQAQEEYAARLCSLLARQAFVLGLGGGHEIGWASYRGARQWLRQEAPSGVLGILNFDAHFDLREPAPAASSGTPFLQVARDADAHGEAFRYACIGIARTANTQALFNRADELQVPYLLDSQCVSGSPEVFLRRFLSELDYLYVTVCLDVFPSSCAPGVSAPAALGVSPAWVIQALEQVGGLCRELEVGWLLADVAELSPPHDRGGMTARLAARILDELICARFKR